MPCGRKCGATEIFFCLFFPPDGLLLPPCPTPFWEVFAKEHDGGLDKPFAALTVADVALVLGVGSGIQGSERRKEWQGMCGQGKRWLGTNQLAPFLEQSPC